MYTFTQALQRTASLTLAVFCTLAILSGIDELAQPEAQPAAHWAQPAQGASAPQA